MALAKLASVPITSHYGFHVAPFHVKSNTAMHAIRFFSGIARIPLVSKRLILPMATILFSVSGHATADYLQDLLAATPGGGWVKASTGTLSSAFVTDPALLPDSNLNLITAPANVVYAWSSVAWDSTRNSLMLWGGGHASHAGNEMYVWDGNTGAWSLGALPSRLVNVPSNDTANRTWLVIDDQAPQSAHTYEGNLYLPVNDRFMTFGGVAWNDAGVFRVRDDNGNLVTAGPWLWDPAKADPNRVGGTTGSGWNSATEGGDMWANRQGQWNWVGTPPSQMIFINNTTDYRTENGRDVVYVTTYDSGSWPSLYRYTLGDISAGELDTWELVGITSNAPSNQASGAIDEAHNIYVHTTTWTGTGFDLNVWDLTKSGTSNSDIGIHLITESGAAFDIDETYAIDYSAEDGALYLWNGVQGIVYRTRALFNADGSLATTWVIEALASTTSAIPDGNYRYGVLGKWQYIDALGAFVALDEYNQTTGDAGVWLYKPLTVPVPEPATTGMLLAGLALVGAAVLRKRRSDAC